MTSWITMVWMMGKAVTGWLMPATVWRLTTTPMRVVVST